MLPTAQPTCFLIADISGYTSYLAGVELEHAHDILADLVGTVVDSLGPTFSLAKLEGDAAFTYFPTDAVDGSMLLDTIENCYFTFRRRRRDVRQATSCDCNACTRIPDLDLKFVAHHGRAIYQDVAGHRELLGPDVITVHRMLKNTVVEDLGVAAYALISQQCVDASDVEPEALGMRSHLEAFEGIGDVAAWAYDLELRWQEEEERRRVFVTADEAILNEVIPTPVPPQIAWEFLTTPGQRKTWQPWVTEVEVKGAVGGRRGVGSSNHCAHGPEAAIEEILDWRPYDYVTDRTIIESPEGSVHFLHTIEFEPDGEGTVIHFRFALPDDETERSRAEQLAPVFAANLRSRVPALLEQLDVMYADRVANRATEEPPNGASPA